MTGRPRFKQARLLRLGQCSEPFGAAALLQDLLEISLKRRPTPALRQQAFSTSGSSYSLTVIS